ncbi:Centromere protein L, partial [Eschrichtius robustus]|nr:Centromere protein L [Eschrichtius robustus]
MPCELPGKNIPKGKYSRCKDQEDVDPQKFAFLLHKQWTLYSLTPLYKFSYTNFKEYSRLLNAFIAAEKQKGLAVEVGDDFNIKVIFSTLLGMKGTQRDPEAFLVQHNTEKRPAASQRTSVHQAGDQDRGCTGRSREKGGGGHGDEEQVSWKRKHHRDGEDEDSHKENRRKAKVAPGSTEKSKYGKKSTHDWDTMKEGRSPQSLDISYAIHPEDAKALWDSVHKTPGEVTQEEVDLFMDCLYSHFHRHFKIHLSATRLVRVSTSVASAHTDGKIKILCHKYLIGVLAYLTELAIFQIE